jgi:hypothetical protein
MKPTANVSIRVKLKLGSINSDNRNHVEKGPHGPAPNVALAVSFVEKSIFSAVPKLCEKTNLLGLNSLFLSFSLFSDDSVFFFVSFESIKIMIPVRMLLK